LRFCKQGYVKHDSVLEPNEVMLWAPLAQFLWLLSSNAQNCAAEFYFTEFE